MSPKATPRASPFSSRFSVHEPGCRGVHVSCANKICWWQELTAISRTPHLSLGPSSSCHQLRETARPFTGAPSSQAWWRGLARRQSERNVQSGGGRLRRPRRADLPVRPVAPEPTLVKPKRSQTNEQVASSVYRPFCDDNVLFLVALTS